MQRTTILAEMETIDRLKALARQRGVSFAHVVREALEAKASEYRPTPGSIGVGDSGEPNRVAETVATEPVPPVPWR